MLQNLTIVYFKDRGLYVGFVEEIPGANSQGRTLAELKRNLAEAAELIIETNRELAGREFGGRRFTKTSLTLATA